MGEAARKRGRLVWIPALLVLAVVAAAGWPALRARGGAGAADSPYAGVVDAGVERALLRGEWSAVADGLAATTPTTQLCLPRLIKGHACLALNRNNESLCLFTQASSDDGLKEWEAYTASLVRAHPEVSVAHYLRGDALARRHDWEGALQSLDRAQALDPKDALVLNARGVVRAAKGRWNLAIVDLAEATEVNPDLADAWCNRGAVSIHRKTGAEGALASFARALQISPDFALARHGRGCVQLVLNRTAEAQQDFDASAQAGACAARLLLGNALSIQAYLQGMTQPELVASLQGEAPGMALDKRWSQAASAFGEWSARPDSQRLYNRMHNSVHNLPSYQQDKFFNQVLAPAFADSPDLAARGQRCENRITDWQNGVGGQVGKWVQGLGGKVGTIPGVGFEQWSQKTQSLNRNWQSHYGGLDIKPSPSLPAGVDTSLATAAFDDGDWPFHPYYGLSYETLDSEA